MKVDKTEGRRPSCIGKGSGAAEGPQQGTGPEARWGSRGRSPRKQNEFDLFTLTKSAFP